MDVVERIVRSETSSTLLSELSDASDSPVLHTVVTSTSRYSRKRTWAVYTYQYEESPSPFKIRRLDPSQGSQFFWMALLSEAPALPPPPPKKKYPP